MKLRFLFPADPRDARRIDEKFAQEAADLLDQGHEMSVVDVSTLLVEQARLTPPLWFGQRVIYRGWPLPAQENAALVRLIEAGGGAFFSTDREHGAEALVEIEDEDGAGFGWAPSVWRAVG